MGRRAVTSAVVLGEREAIVRDVRRFEIHGSPFVDVTLGNEDEMLETARLGAESVPEHLEVGEHVVVSTAMNMIVGIRRP